MSKTGTSNNVTRREAALPGNKVLVYLSLLPTPRHLPPYQVSFSFLHCLLKIDWNFSDILCLPQVNIKAVINTLSVKLRGDKVQRQKVSVL
jgi:hypothetical protein